MTKRCLREPIESIFQAAKTLSEASKEHLKGNSSAAADLFRSTNLDEVRAWTESIWGAQSPYVNPMKIPNAPPTVPKDKRHGSRMPDAATKMKILERDGYHCTFCGIPVIAPETRKKWHKLYPEAIPWGNRNIGQHAAFQAMWMQFDHILPHSRGGTSDLQNMVITCAPCNFGKMEYTLEELGLEDPRNLPRIESNWDGLRLA